MFAAEPRASGRDDSPGSCNSDKGSASLEPQQQIHSPKSCVSPFLLEVAMHHRRDSILLEKAKTLKQIYVSLTMATGEHVERELRCAESQGTTSLRPGRFPRKFQFYDLWRFQLKQNSIFQLQDCEWYWVQNDNVRSTLRRLIRGKFENPE